MEEMAELVYRHVLDALPGGGQQPLVQGDHPFPHQAGAPAAFHPPQAEGGEGHPQFPEGRVDLLQYPGEELAALFIQEPLHQPLPPGGVLRVPEAQLHGVALHRHPLRGPLGDLQPQFSPQQGQPLPGEVLPGGGALPHQFPELPDGPVDETGLLDHKGVQLGHRHPPPGGKVDAAIPPDPEVQVFHRLALQLVGDGAVGGDDGAGGDGFLWHRQDLRVQRMAPLRQAARGALGWDRTMIADGEGERKRGIF